LALDPQASRDEGDMNELSEMKCTACRRGEPTLTEAEIAELRPQVPDWQSNASPARSQRSVRYTDATEPPSTR
jgi:4a-hydroxytetrahydrobiopterin dehydratase